MIKKFTKFIWRLPRYIAMGIISGYQKVLSPDHSFWAKALYPNGYCKFTPTCSDYSKEAFEKYGVVGGFFKSAWRVMRCNPWNKGGTDRP